MLTRIGGLQSDGTWSYSYDDVGRLTKKSKGSSAETWTYSYDHRGQLTQADKRATDGGALQGRLEYGYDGFGNLSIEYRMSEGGLKVLEGLGFKAPDRVISTTGRSVINVDQQSIVYVDDKAQPFDPKVAAGRANPFALERTRYYDFGPDGTLTLTTRHDGGKNAVVSKWKKG